MKTFSVRLDDQQRAAVGALADARKVDEADIVRECIEIAIPVLRRRQEVQPEPLEEQPA